MCSIATINAREKDTQGPWKIAVAYRTSDSKQLATKLLEFEVTLDILNGEYRSLHLIPNEYPHSIVVHLLL